VFDWPTSAQITLVPTTPILHGLLRTAKWGDSMKIFWSWQSDLPGKISRHFVREALEDAVDALNEERSVYEPERPEASLDHDRKGVPGSPDLANIILEKIRGSEVFVADVTPVGQSNATPPKSLMNANVAIELGYALHTIGDGRLMMVLNKAFGSRADLPFDLQHKGGPIFYNLTSTASKNQIAAEKKKLTSKFKVAIREISAAHTTVELDVTRDAHIDGDPSRYFRSNDLIVNVEEDGFRNVGRKFFGPKGPLVFLRVIPTQISQKLGFNQARDALMHAQVRPFAHDWSSMSVDNNRWGAVSYETKSDENTVLAATQLHRNCEVWGFDSYLPSPTHKPNDGGPPGIWAKNLEEAFQINLPNYVKLLADQLGISAPFKVVAGLSSVEEHILAVPSSYGGTKRLGPFLEDPLVIELTLLTTEFKAINAVLLKIYEGIFDGVGAVRPPQFRGFPKVITDANYKLDI